MRALLPLLAIACCCIGALACGGYGGAPQPVPLEVLTEQALSDDAAIAGPARTALRARGRSGLDALLQRSDRERAGQPQRPWDPAIDAVAGQLLASTSRLYWHTDLDAAKAEAAASGRPILSLHLLGRLDERFSCANSRFFRTVLYADPAIAAVLRERFVLHAWSERPVPRITIDFGDGRRQESTITGNSAHYVLDAQGRPRDVLPGLVGPGAFRTWLGEALARAAAPPASVGTVPGTARTAARPADAATAGMLAESKSDVEGPLLRALGRAAPAPAAIDAAPLAPSKSMIERPMLQVIGRGGVEARWALDGAQLARSEVALAPESLALIRAELEGAMTAAGLNPLAAPHQQRITELLGAFDASLRIDTARNRLDLQPKARAFIDAGTDLKTLNQRIYRELFLTPFEDPWMGLDPLRAYDGLGRFGVQVGGC